MPLLLSWIAPTDAEGSLERRDTPFGQRGQELLVLAAREGSGIHLSPLRVRDAARDLVDGGAARLEDVESHHGPAEGLEMIVDVQGQPSIAPTPLGLAGAIAAGPSLATAAIEHHLDGR